MKFPQIQSTRRVSSNAVIPQTSSIDVSPITNAVTQAVQEWSNAKDITESNTAYNDIEQKQLDIFKRASEETDFNNQQKYIDEVEELRGQAKFTNPQAAQRFQRVADNTANNGSIKIQSLFRDKMIKHQQGELIRTEDLQKNAYLQGNPESKEVYSGILEESFKSGFVDKATYDQKKEDLKTWELERAMFDVGTDPQFVLDNIDGYELDKREKSDVIKDAQSIIDRFDSLDEYSLGTKQEKMQKAIEQENIKTETLSRYDIFDIKNGEVKNKQLNNIESLVQFKQELKNSKASFVNPKTKKVDDKFNTINSQTQTALYKMAQNDFGEQNTSVNKWNEFGSNYHMVGNNVLSNIDTRIPQKTDKYISFKASVYEDTVIALTDNGLDLYSEDPKQIEKAQEVANKVYLNRIRGEFGGLEQYKDETLLKSGTFENLDLNKRRNILFPKGANNFKIEKKPKKELTADQKANEDVFKSLGL